MVSARFDGIHQKASVTCIGMSHSSHTRDTTTTQHSLPFIIAVNILFSHDQDDTPQPPDKTLYVCDPGK